MPPSVLMLGWGYPPNVTGGLDTHVGEMYPRLRDAGVDIELVLPAEYAPEDDVEGLHPVPTGEGDILGRIGRLGRTFVEKAPEFDIVHTHDWFGFGPGSRAQAKADVTWVSVYHPLSSDRNLYPPEREVNFEQRIADTADELVSVSELTAKEVRERYGADSTVIYNGFSTPKFKGVDRKEELGIDGPMLFYVGRHTDQKGLGHLLYAVKKLRDKDVTLVMGGKGHQTPALKQFADHLGINDQVEWAGYIPEEELGDYYASADLFVSPSFAEPFGITITEALQAGTRIVATPSGALEVLPENCAVEVAVDSDSIATGIEEGLAMEGEPEFEPYTWEDAVSDTVEFYERIV